jgi:hypothetical protein
MTFQRKMTPPTGAQAPFEHSAPNAQEIPSRFAQLRISAVEHFQMVQAAMTVTCGHWPSDPADQSDIGLKLAERLRIVAPETIELVETLAQEKNDAIYMTALPKAPIVARSLAVAFAHVLGIPFNYAPQNGGKLVMELVPDPTAGAHTNATTGDFGAHTDDAAMPYAVRTRFISLYGLTNPPKTLTGYAPTQTALIALRKHDTLSFVEPLLHEERFEVRFPTSFGLPKDVWSGPMAILRDLDNGRLETRFPSYAVRPVEAADYEAWAASAVLHAALMAHTVHVPVDPGTYLAFNNARGAHCRGTVGDGDRFILRTYALPDLQALQAKTQVEGPIFPLAPFVEDIKG